VPCGKSSRRRRSHHDLHAFVAAAMVTASRRSESSGTCRRVLFVVVVHIGLIVARMRRIIGEILATIVSACSWVRPKACSTLSHAAAMVFLSLRPPTAMDRTCLRSEETAAIVDHRPQD